MVQGRPQGTTHTSEDGSTFVILIAGPRRFNGDDNVLCVFPKSVKPSDLEIENNKRVVIAGVIRLVGPGFETVFLDDCYIPTEDEIRKTKAYSPTRK